MNTTVIPPSLLDVDFPAGSVALVGAGPGDPGLLTCAPGPCCNRPRWWSTTAWSPAS